MIIKIGRFKASNNSQSGSFLFLGVASFWIFAQSQRLRSRHVELVKLAIGSSAIG